MFSRNGADKNERKKLPLWYRAVSLVLTVAAIAAVCFALCLCWWRKRARTAGKFSDT